MAKDCLGYSSNTEKRLLKQFINYLSKVANMNVQYSNYVYVVSLSPNSTEISPYSYIQVVEISVNIITQLALVVAAGQRLHQTILVSAIGQDYNQYTILNLIR